MAGKKKESWMNRDTGKHLIDIDRSSISPAAESVTINVDDELLCSYNWTNDRKATIYVPGGAPSWTGGDLPKTISPDSGRQYVNQDGAKVPKHPFESVFRAIEVQRPEYRFNKIDCLINRNSLRKLFDFCKGIKMKSDSRLNLYVVHNTLIVERCEKSAVEMLNGSANSGYGHNFERAFTKYAKGLDNSTSHHRVLQYKFGGLEMAVRFEVDASHVLEADGAVQDTILPANETRLATEQLSRGLNSLKLAPKNQKVQQTNTSSIIVRQKGKGTLQSTTAEIKTAWKAVQMSKVLPQMWFGRTPLLIKGVHSDGEFHKISIEPIDLERWESDARHQLALRKMVALIERLRSFVMSTSTLAVIAVFHKRDADKLKIFERKVDRSPLPEDVIETFWAGE